jgi:hypothetical protein
MEGKPNFAVYNFKNGDRLNTGFPILLDGQPTYFVFIITPMSVIYSQMDKAMSTERMEMFSLLVGMTVAIVLLVIFLIRWSSTLDSEVISDQLMIQKLSNMADCVLQLRPLQRENDHLACKPATLILFPLVHCSCSFPCHCRCCDLILALILMFFHSHFLF